MSLLVAGCGASPGPTPSFAPVETSASLEPSPALRNSAAASVPNASGLRVEAEPGLLALVPGGGNGLDFTYDAETTASVASDPDLARNLVGLAIGLYRVTGSGPDDPNFAIVNVAQRRDASLDEAWFRDWRDTYDTAACAQAGGVVGHAQTQMVAGTVYIGSCAGGPLTYHLRLREGAIVVSVTSIGPMRLGEKVMKAIEP
jgi:hypothetical protein